MPARTEATEWESWSPDMEADSFHSRPMACVAESVREGAGPQGLGPWTHTVDSSRATERRPVRMRWSWMARKMKDSSRGVRGCGTERYASTTNDCGATASQPAGSAARGRRQGCTLSTSLLSLKRAACSSLMSELHAVGKPVPNISRSIAAMMSAASDGSDPPPPPPPNNPIPPPACT